MKMSKFAVGVASLVLAVSANAIVVSDYDAAVAGPTEYGYDFNWDYVYNYKGCSAVAVDAYWVLTAAHVADDSGDGVLVIDGVTYTPQEIVYDSSGEDLALVRYDIALPGYYSVGDYSTGDSVIMVGYGTTGTIDSETTYTAGSSGQGVKRWGTNTILYEDYSLTVDGRASNEFLMDYNTSATTNEVRQGHSTETVITTTATDYEAGVGTGDSGGGVFTQNAEGEWELVGIMNASLATDTMNYVGAVQLSDYADWITATIPEPATMAIFGMGMFGLLGYRRREAWMRAIRFRSSKKVRAESVERPLVQSRFERLDSLRARFGAAPQLAPKSDWAGDLVLKLDDLMRRR